MKVGGRGGERWTRGSNKHKTLKVEENKGGGR